MSKRGENIYRRQDGRWEGRYQKGRKSDGRVHYGSVYGQTYREVKQKLYPLKVKYASVIQIKGTCATPLYQWAGQWLAHIQSRVKPSTYASYRYKLEHYILPQLGETPLNQVEVAHIQELVTHWQEQSLRTSTIHVLFQVLKGCLARATAEGLLLANPCTEVSLPRKEKAPVHSLSKREQRKLEHVARSVPQQKGLPVLLALQAGLRIGEIAALKWQDINFERNTLTITHTYQRIPLAQVTGEKTQLVYQEAKTAAAKRSIPMTKELCAKLKERGKKAQEPFVFSSGNRPCEPRLLTHYFHQLCQKAQLAQTHFHQLRHTFATRCLEKTRDIASISALLGHTSTQMTLDIYTDSLLEQRERIIHALEA